MDEVSLEQHIGSSALADEVRRHILKIEEQMAEKGQELKVVMVARKGESLDGMNLLVDNRDMHIQSFLNRLSNVHRLSNTVGSRTGVNALERKHNISLDGVYNPDGSPLTHIYRNRRNGFYDRLRTNERLQYSHFGFFIKDYKNDTEIAHPDKHPRWSYAVDLLAECDPDSSTYGDSYIFHGKSNQFYWDTELLTSEKHRASLLVVPSMEIQENLYNILMDRRIAGGGVPVYDEVTGEPIYEDLKVFKADGSYTVIKAIKREFHNLDNLHQENYNSIAMPYSIFPNSKRPDLFFQLDEQNSNQWPLEVIAAATHPHGVIRYRMQAQQILINSNYRPSIFTADSAKLFNACTASVLFKSLRAILNCAAQPLRYRQDKIALVISVRSVVEWMLENSLIEKSIYAPGQPAIHEVSVSFGEIEMGHGVILCHEANISNQSLAHLTGSERYDLYLNCVRGLGVDEIDLDEHRNRKANPNQIRHLQMNEL